MPIGAITPGSYVNVTPDASPTPVGTIQAPTATMPVTAADIQALTLELLNAINASDIIANMIARTDATEGMRHHVSETLYYEYTASTPFTPTSRWVYTATGMGVGQWVHGAIATVNLGMFAPLGTVPGGWANGEINKLDAKFVPWGFFTGGFIADTSDTTTDTTVITTTAGDIPTIGGTGTITVGALKTNDILSVDLSGWGFNTSGKWGVGVTVSFDNGATWNFVHARNAAGPMFFDQNSSGTGVAVPLGFTMEVPSNGTCLVRWRFNAVTAGTTTLAWGKGRYYVLRAPANSW